MSKNEFVQKLAIALVLICSGFIVFQVQHQYVQLVTIAADVEVIKTRLEMIEQKMVDCCMEATNDLDLETKGIAERKERNSD